MAAIFGSLPLAGRIILGGWEFAGSAELAGVLFVIGGYLHIVSRRPVRTMPDASAMLERAMRLAVRGRIDRAIALLTEEIRMSPRLWQALQYRGELYLVQRRAEDALRDFDEAIALAPEEPHLSGLREQALAQRDG